MITCDECGKVLGKGQMGTHWICDDCKEGESSDLASNRDNQKVKPKESFADSDMDQNPIQIKVVGD